MGNWLRGSMNYGSSAVDRACSVHRVLPTSGQSSPAIGVTNRRWPTDGTAGVGLTVHLLNRDRRLFEFGAHALLGAATGQTLAIDVGRFWGTSTCTRNPTARCSDSTSFFTISRSGCDMSRPTLSPHFHVSTVYRRIRTSSRQLEIRWQIPGHGAQRITYSGRRGATHLPDVPPPSPPSLPTR